MKRAGQRSTKASSHSRRSVRLALRIRPSTPVLRRIRAGAANAVEVTGLVGAGTEKRSPQASALRGLPGGTVSCARGEGRLHLAAKGDCGILRIDRHVGPGDDLPLPDGPGQPDIVGESQG